jgi:hypothetical protein
MYDVYGVICGTYEEACIVAGIETPAQIDAEIAWQNACDEIEHLSRPVRCWRCLEAAAREVGEPNDDPFPF